MLIFISGGVRSGKSSMAENLAVRFFHPSGRLLYVACGQQTDREMDHRILLHQERRLKSGYQWETVEQSADIEEVQVDSNDTVLIDCVTTLLAGEYFRTDKPSFQAEARIVDGIAAIHEKARTVVVVSNELSFEAPLTQLTGEYMKTLGQIHQRLVEKSDIAFLAEHGISVVKKGEQSCVE